MTSLAARLRDALGKHPKAKPSLCASLPTPLESMESISRAWKRRVYVKREDQTGLAFGGNKTRMLQYVLGAAQRDHVTDIVGGAGFESNYCRQLACACAKLGITAHLTLRRTQKDDPCGVRAAEAGNLLPSMMSGARIEVLDEVEEAGHHVSKAHHARMRDVWRRLRAEGREARLLRTASDEDEESKVLETMALGYVEVALELHEQMRARGHEGQYDVWVCSADTTIAGLTAGSRALGGAFRPFAVAPFEKPVTSTRGETHEKVIASVATGAAASLGFSDIVIDPADVNITRAYVGEGYGATTPESLDAIRHVASAEGLLLDPVYTAKAFAAMREQAESEAATSESNESLPPLVFVHTGGLPALYASSYRGILNLGEPEKAPKAS